MELSKIQDVVENLNLIRLKKSNSLRRASAGIPTLHLKPEVCINTNTGHQNVHIFVF